MRWTIPRVAVPTTPTKPCSAISEPAFPSLPRREPTESQQCLYERPLAHAAADLKRYGQLLGLDPSAFAQCLDGGDHQATVDADIEEGLRLGASAAPTFFVNGQMLVGAQSFADFRRLVENELAGLARR